MIKINVILANTIWKKYLRNPQNFLNIKVRKLNKKNRSYKKKILNCSLLLSGTKEIKNLNKKFRKKNKSTDILSFPFYEKKFLLNIIKKKKEIYLGDMIININMIKKKNNLTKFKEEFNKLWIHGLLHLLGFNHKKNKDFNTMSRIEKKYLKYIN